MLTLEKMVMLLQHFRIFVPSQENLKKNIMLTAFNWVSNISLFWYFQIKMQGLFSFFFFFSFLFQFRVDTGGKYNFLLPQRLLIKIKYVCLIYTGAKEQWNSSLFYRENICSIVAWFLCLKEDWTSSTFLHMKQQLSRETVGKLNTQLEVDDSAQIQTTVIITTSTKRLLMLRKSSNLLMVLIFICQLH